MTAGAAPSEGWTGAGGFVSKMAHSNKLESSVVCSLGFSIGLLECPYNRAADLS